MPQPLPVQNDGLVALQVLPGEHVVVSGLGSFHGYEKFGAPPTLAETLIRQGKVRPLRDYADGIAPPPPPSPPEELAVPLTPEGTILVDALPRWNGRDVLIELTRKYIGAGSGFMAGETASFSPTVAAQLLAEGYGRVRESPSPKAAESPRPALQLVRLLGSYRPLGGSAFHKGEVVGVDPDEARRLIAAGAAEAP